MPRTMTKLLSRRQALSRVAAAAALGALFAPPRPLAAHERAQATPTSLGDPFALGVASGQPRPDGIVLWTRLAPQPLEPMGGLPPLAVPVRWQLARDERFADMVREGVHIAVPEHAFSVHVPVRSLPSDQRFFYRFIAGDAVSCTGRTRTAPAADATVARLRLALASCQHYEQGHFAVHREIAQQDLDMVLFVGDYIYETDRSGSQAQVRKHPSAFPQDVDGYRARHASYKLDADLQAAHAAHPWLLVWDDHEVRNDYAGERAAGMTSARFMQLRQSAYQAYFEHMPLVPDQAPQAGAMRMHDQFEWGRLAHLWTLDDRQYRSVQGCGGEEGGGHLRWNCAELADRQRTMLGEAQQEWLSRGLHTSQRTWKLLAQATQISPWGVDVPFSHGVFTDGWDGYPAAREQLLQLMQDAQLRNVVALGGDVHRHVAALLRRNGNDAASPVLASEFVTSSITSRGLPETAMHAVRAANPDLLHARSDERGYAVLDVTPAMVHCELRATAYPVNEHAVLHTQARFVVEEGQAGPQRA